MQEASPAIFFFEAKHMGILSNEPKQRVIQEYVPGKQITLAHVIASPNRGN